MCLGIPGCLIERLEPIGGIALGLVEFGGARRSVCIACVPDAQLGDYVIVHAGIAIARIDADDAERLLRELAATGEVLTGEGLTGEAGDSFEPANAARG